MEKYNSKDYVCKINKTTREIIFASIDDMRVFKPSNITGFEFSSNYLAFLYNRDGVNTKIYYYFDHKTSEIEELTSYLMSLNKNENRSNNIDFYDNKKINNYTSKKKNQSVLKRESIYSVLCSFIVVSLQVMFFLTIFGDYYKIAGITIKLYESDATLLPLTGGMLVASYVGLINLRKSSLFIAILGSIFGTYILIYDSIILSKANYLIIDIHLAFGIIILLSSLIIAIFNVNDYKK